MRRKLAKEKIVNRRAERERISETKEYENREKILQKVSERKKVKDMEKKRVGRRGRGGGVKMKRREVRERKLLKKE